MKRYRAKAVKKSAEGKVDNARKAMREYLALPAKDRAKVNRLIAKA